MQPSALVSGDTNSQIKSATNESGGHCVRINRNKGGKDYGRMEGFASGPKAVPRFPTSRSDPLSGFFFRFKSNLLFVSRDVGAEEMSSFFLWRFLLRSQ